MIIEFGDYRISSDNYSYQLDNNKLITGKGKNAGTKKWEVVGWYADLQQCINAVAKHHLRVSESKTIKELQLVVDNLMQDMKKIKINIDASLEDLKKGIKDVAN